ncbi:set domain protein [Culex quinquefasciatus]|uniref:Set domain protein n=1 Tax=Culex quinquefasciatus TaxID=7176 RepID=B0WH55_CULQU|nr:set domain protein [Culex quinquefasciatus]|eukprot:XP_001848069.1 set domain protein [Culex quinquefasciatus]
MSFFVPDVKCIPAGFQLLTTSIMICPKHSLEQCSINGNGAIRAESHLHLQLRVQVLARAHDSPASGPGRGIPAATQAKGHLREVINNEELPRRIYQKDENYYFLTVDSEQTIDAGPKGNLARFINYSSPTARRCCGRSPKPIRADCNVGYLLECSNANSDDGGNYSSSATRLRPSTLRIHRDKCSTLPRVTSSLISKRSRGNEPLLLIQHVCNVCDNVRQNGLSDKTHADSAITFLSLVLSSAVSSDTDHSSSSSRSIIICSTSGTKEATFFYVRFRNISEHYPTVKSSPRRYFRP